MGLVRLFGTRSTSDGTAFVEQSRLWFNSLWDSVTTDLSGSRNELPVYGEPPGRGQGPSPPTVLARRHEGALVMTASPGPVEGLPRWARERTEITGLLIALRKGPWSNSEAYLVRSSMIFSTGASAIASGTRSSAASIARLEVGDGAMGFRQLAGYQSAGCTEGATMSCACALPVLPMPAARPWTLVAVAIRTVPMS